jgi:hypothetical protein
LAKGSLFQNGFVHSPDDTVKIGADGFVAQEMTIFQGNAGYVIMVGNYGNIPNDINKADITNVYVHRVAQGTEGWDKHGALIGTRNNGALGHKINGVTISGLTVPSLGGVLNADGGMKGPNAVWRTFAIGFSPEGKFRRRLDDGFLQPKERRLSPVTVFSNWIIMNSNIYANPLARSMIYGGLNGFDPKDYGFDGPMAKIEGFAFYDLNNTTGKCGSKDGTCFFNTALKMWPQPYDDPDYYYCAWPVGAGGDGWGGKDTKWINNPGPNVDLDIHQVNGKDIVTLDGTWGEFPYHS